MRTSAKVNCTLPQRTRKPAGRGVLLSAAPANSRFPAFPGMSVQRIVIEPAFTCTLRQCTSGLLGRGVPRCPSPAFVGYSPVAFLRVTTSAATAASTSSPAHYVQTWFVRARGLVGHYLCTNTPASGPIWPYCRPFVHQTWLGRTILRTNVVCARP